jgi:maltose alpha-D-glucosyltransferase/alpha-amylase
MKKDTWYLNAVFYQIYPQTFCDSDGDGIGDLNGIISKLDYLKELGVDALWLNPIFESPMLDAGYDVTDYRKIIRATARWPTSSGCCASRTSAASACSSIWR